MEGNLEERKNEKFEQTSATRYLYNIHNIWIKMIILEICADMWQYL